MSVRPLAEADLSQLFALRQISYLDRRDYTDAAVYEAAKARLPYLSGHFLGDKLTSAAVVYPFEMFLAGRRTRTGGLAGVLSAPETRRRGYVRELLRDVLERLRQEGTGWLLEYPFDPRFYARLGFATVPTGYEVTVPAERLFRGPAPDAERLTGDPKAVLEPLYHAWAEPYSLALRRDNAARPTWSRILDDDTFCYVMEDAYAVLELTEDDAGQTLTVHDYAFSSPAGRAALFRFVGSFYGQADRISLHLPDDEPLAWDLQTFHTNELPALQARITDLQAALGPMTSPLEQTLTLTVRDPLCTWNDGTFAVALTPAGNTVTAHTGQNDPALTLDIGALTQLVVGALRPDAALRCGLAEGDLAAAQALYALSGGRVTFMPSSDYF